MYRENALNLLQEALGYHFKNKGLLMTALCHSSYANENGLPESNERLEFLGDSVLGMVAAYVLYDSCPNASEGDLSRHKVSYVCRDALLIWAEKLGVADVLLKGKSLKNGYHPSIFADTVEALIGAVYIDGGYDEVLRVVKRHLFESNVSVFDEHDFKSRLQVFLQANDMNLPRYEVLSVKGPSHSPQFCVKVCAAGRTWLGEGKTRKTAELEAAAAALEFLKNTDYAE